MTKNNYPEPNQSLNFAKMEEDILKFWQDEKIFEKSVEIRNFSDDSEEDNVSPVLDHCALKEHSHCRHSKEEKSEFVFYDGPPFANGLPHYGHLLTGFIKDIFARYQTMKGKKVERKFGWDTHGLPVEMETEKELTSLEGKPISGQIAIQEYGIGKFNDACRKSVMKYEKEWENYVTRQGRFVDFKNSYKTMDVNYMESVIWAFSELYRKGLIYEKLRVVPYSWACQTPLSNFETRMDNSYRQKASKAVTVKFELEEESTKRLGFEGKKVSLVAWTTTPWTLPSNLGLAVGRNINYAAVKVGEEILILAEGLLGKFAKDFDAKEVSELEIFSKIKGSDLVGLSYKPLFLWFQKFRNGDFRLPNPANNEPAGVLIQTIPVYPNCFSVLHGDFVSTEEGTGIVHMAPGFGEDDQTLCEANSIPIICPVDEGGKFDDVEIKQRSGKNVFIKIDPEYKGRHVFETNDDIIKYLKETGVWIKTEQYLHNYPHCWRTDTPLIYKAVSSWYVKVTDIKDRMVELNQGINWIPDHIKDGQFGKWLEGARDWSITRNRFWGCPVPVWRSNDPTYPRIDVYGSLDDLARDFGVRPTDLHRPFIDQLTRPNPDDPTGKSKMVRVTDVLDCWFESGSMPYAQMHYPFENKERFEQNFPADFITEYVAQTRGWFYTLMVLSTALFDKAPFKNVICHGTILDENSQKLSKRLRNYADPLEIFSTFGSDAMRFYMISQPVMRGQELRIDKEGKAIRDTLRISIKPLINAFNFFCLYANADGITAQRIEIKKRLNNTLDRYILSKLKSTISKIDESMKNYDTVTACEEFNQFFEVLNNWYIRRSRSRFWDKINDGITSEDKQNAYDVLYTILLSMCEASAPLLPFTSEFVWKNLSQINVKS